jgi:hypothetical protein
MIFYKRYIVCVLLGAFSGLSAATEMPASSLLQDYGVSADQLPKPIKPDAIQAKPEPRRFPMTPEKPLVNFRFTDKPKPAVTGNPSIDNLNTRQLDECLRAFGGSSIACRQDPVEQPVE